jgi:hypothetical protein
LKKDEIKEEMDGLKKMESKRIVKEGGGLIQNREYKQVNELEE